MPSPTGIVAEWAMTNRPAIFIDLPGRPRLGGMDVLDSVLRELRFESTAYRSLRLGAPFRVSFAEPGLRGVHVVVQGQCEVSVNGGRPLPLSTGDLVLFPRGDPHVLSSPGDGAGPAQSGVALATSAAPGDEVRGGGRGVETLILCGAFLVTRLDHPALNGLPRVVHVAASSAGQRWLAPYVAALTAEVQQGGPGSAVVTARLSDALVARALRFQIDVLEEPGLLRGLADPYVAAALAAMHEDLARPWTVAMLGAVAGLSRAAFAARFRERVGTAPANYLTALRMGRASTLLRDERATLAAVAVQVGYGSEAAFSAAFKRYIGVAPGAYRLRTVPSRGGRTGGDPAGVPGPLRESIDGPQREVGTH
jgi:AraC-like DNA-binding protein